MYTRHLPPAARPRPNESIPVRRWSALWLWFACTLTVNAATGGVRETFHFDSPAHAQQTWLARDASPLVQPTADGLQLAVPFATHDRDRVYWDRAVNWNLAQEDLFVLEVSCPQPEAMRSLAIYLRSGDGWYIWNRPLPGSGRRTLSLMRGDFETEGQPAGWDHISSIRISPWRGQSVDTTLTLHRWQAVRAPVVLVRSANLPLTEREPARRATARISQWLHDVNIPHAIWDESEVNLNRLQQKKIVVLPYMPELSKRFRDHLADWVPRGGQVVVFYSNDERLARLLGFRLGRYAAAEQPGQWSAIRFIDAPPPVPERVYQQSWNIRPAHPATADAKVIAYWENALGQRTNDPAWTASPRGLWMAHILLPGDDVSKRDMLGGLLAQRHPPLWSGLARRAVQQAGQVGPYADFATAVRQLQGAGHTRANRREIERLLKNAQEQHQRLLQHYRRRQYPQTVALQRQLQRNLVEAYARAQTTRSDELRGVWDHHGTGLFPGAWERTGRVLANHGINALFPNLMWAGLAHYPSEVLPRSTTYRVHGDQLAQSIAAARAHKQQLHVWVVCWNLTGAPADFVQRARREGRLMQGADGQELPWLNPAHPANVDLLLAGLHEVATNYDIDGLHLDYIRYPNRAACFSPYTRRRFEESSGRPVRHWPADVQAGGAREAEFRQFRIRVISAVVERIHDEIRPAHPDLKLSAAVWGGYPDILSSIAQDWPTWLQRGWLDYVVPMNYFNDAAQFRHLTQTQLQLPGTQGRIIPGIGVTSSESQLPPDQAILQINHARELGAPGWVLFDLNPTLRTQTLPALRHGLTR